MSVSGERAASDLRVLHLFANYKWTGPADPALRTAVRARARGVDAQFAQAAWIPANAEHRMAKELWRARLPVVGDLELRKHFHLVSHVRDARALRRRLDRDDYDVVHAHLLADHLVAALAKRRARRPVALVRSLYDAEAPRRSWRTLLAFRHTDAVVVPTLRSREQVLERFRVDPSRVLYQDPVTEGFRRELVGDLRAQLGLAREQFAIGITARIQPHRRFRLLWEIARAVVDECPHVVFVLLGRGNDRDRARFVDEPVRDLGLTDNVRLPGYLYEPDYSLALRALDAFVFLVPGSDGTCRALREAMALGLPIVTTRRGMLPDLCAEHPELSGTGPAGLACEETLHGLSEGLLSVVRDAELRARLRRGALARVRGPMDPVRADDRLLALYRDVVRGGGGA